jgi:hypothetical protein
MQLTGVVADFLSDFSIGCPENDSRPLDHLTKEETSRILSTIEPIDSRLPNKRSTRGGTNRRRTIKRRFLERILAKRRLMKRRSMQRILRKRSLMERL